MSIFAIMLQDEGLTFREVISDIPHDVPALVVYVILAVFVGFIWWGSRSGKSGPGTGGPPSASMHPPTAKDRG